jgi:hypothetical protein
MYSAIVDKRLDTCRQSAEHRLHKIWRREQLGFTLNDDGLSAYKRNVLHLYDVSVSAILEEYGDVESLRPIIHDPEVRTSTLDCISDARAYFQRRSPLILFFCSSDGII